jgi:hypothetical protein
MLFGVTLATASFLNAVACNLAPARDARMDVTSPLSGSAVVGLGHVAEKPAAWHT